MLIFAKVVGYSDSKIAGLDDDILGSSPFKAPAKESASDNDFNAASDTEESDADAGPLSPGEIQFRKGMKARKSSSNPRTPQKQKIPSTQKGTSSSKKISTPAAKNSSSSKKSPSAKAAGQTSKPVARGSKIPSKQVAPRGRSSTSKVKPEPKKIAQKTGARPLAKPRTKPALKKETSNMQGPPAAKKVQTAPKTAGLPKQVSKAATNDKPNPASNPRKPKQPDEINGTAQKQLADNIKQTSKTTQPKHHLSDQNDMTRKLDKSSKKNNSSSQADKDKTVKPTAKTASASPKRPASLEIDTQTDNPSPLPKKPKHSHSPNTSDTQSLKENFDIVTPAKPCTSPENAPSR